MISKSPGRVSVISQFSPVISSKNSVNCLDESIAVGFEEGNILFAFSGSSFRTARNCHRHGGHICMCFRIHRHVVAAFVHLT